MVADSTLRRRAARGAAFLDERASGWAERINLDTLDVIDIYRCPLGQLYGTYGAGMVALDIDPAQDWWYGFLWGKSTDVDVLNCAWKREVAKRREAVSA